MKPSDYTKTQPMESFAGTYEAERVATNIMVILKRTGDKFRPLSWNEYKEERLKDDPSFTGQANLAPGRSHKGEEHYFGQVARFCTSAKTAQSFSPVWAAI